MILWSGHDLAMQKDKLYAQMHDQLHAFRFDDAVVDVFPDMIQRSVPNYATTLLSIGLLAQRYVTSGSHCYDLGCSLGGASLAMGRAIPHQNYKLFAVDQSEAMIQRFSKLLGQEFFLSRFELTCADISNLIISNASIVVLNYTLQFIHLEQRLALLQTIHAGMNEGGVLVLSEKIHAETKAENKRLIALHEAFKKACGYSELEISQKRVALENVLVPETISVHRQRLSQAGFSHVEEIMRGFNFVTLLVHK
ncbi:MAG: carboxy-S-adenosyl-L-methionine synthase CmoA [Mariprofundaceae bacterium]|nr:carboxy-S-adenosyl-L-methionine synthase CmoA [Mariprofundaceae bacterium]